jgi:hypothetical protein
VSTFGVQRHVITLGIFVVPGHALVGLLLVVFLGLVLVIGLHIPVLFVRLKYLLRLLGI